MCLRFLSEKLIYLAGHPFDFGKGEGTGVGWSSSETVSFLSTGGGLESGISLPARMHKFSTVAPKPSGVLHRLRCATRKRVAGFSAYRTVRLRCPRSRVAQRTQDGVFGVSLRKPMHNPG